VSDYVIGEQSGGREQKRNVCNSKYNTTIDKYKSLKSKAKKLPSSGKVLLKIFNSTIAYIGAKHKKNKKGTCNGR
jgi:hypothetical protein